MTSQFAGAAGQERHETHRDQFLALDLFSPLGQPREYLRTGMWPKRDHHDPAIGELIEELLGNLVGGGRDHDAFIGRPLRRTLKSVTDENFHVVDAERLEARARTLRQGAIALDRNDF